MFLSSFGPGQLIKCIMYIIIYFIHFHVALQKAGKHMEDSMVASYVALLLGCIAQDNKVCHVFNIQVP